MTITKHFHFWEQLEGRMDNWIASKEQEGFKIHQVLDQGTTQSTGASGQTIMTTHQGYLVVMTK